MKYPGAPINPDNYVLPKVSSDTVRFKIRSFLIYFNISSSTSVSLVTLSFFLRSLRNIWSSPEYTNTFTHCRTLSYNILSSLGMLTTFSGVRYQSSAYILALNLLMMVLHGYSCEILTINNSTSTESIRNYTTNTIYIRGFPSLFDLLTSHISLTLFKTTISILGFCWLFAVIKEIQTP